MVTIIPRTSKGKMVKVNLVFKKIEFDTFRPPGTMGSNLAKHFQAFVPMK